MTRESFNKSWTVKPKTSIFAQLSSRGTQEATPRRVTLPHDAIIEGPRDASAPGKVAYFPGGAFEYSKTFDVPEEYRGKRVALEFQGVYRDAMVYVNGEYAGQQPFGYSTFLIPLDDYLWYGQSNTIRVDARAHDDSRWYTGAGIYRDTVLIVTNPIHVEPYGLRVTTPDIDTERAVVEVAIALANGGIGTQSVTASSQIRNADGIVVATGTCPVTLRTGASATARHRLYVPEPSLWSVDDPVLYTVEVSVNGGEETLDERTTSFGIRSLKLDPVHGLRINGETVKLRGACIHHDNGLLGSATIGRAEERRIELLKAAGFNAIRSSHNPVSQAMLHACDKHGMLVMDETFDVWTEGKSSFDYSLSFPEWWERDVEAFIAKNFNHPSVIFYSIGNEIPETGNPLGSEWGRRLAEKVRSLDSTRFVTNGVNGFVSAITEVAAMMAQRGAATAQSDEGAANGGVNDMMNSPGDMMNRVSASELVTNKTAESFSVLDVAGMNYGDGRYELDRELFPGRIIVGTETFPPHIAVNWKLVENNAPCTRRFYLDRVGLPGRSGHWPGPVQRRTTAVRGALPMADGLVWRHRYHGSSTSRVLLPRDRIRVAARALHCGTAAGKLRSRVHAGPVVVDRFDLQLGVARPGWYTYQGGDLFGRRRCRAAPERRSGRQAAGRP